MIIVSLSGHEFSIEIFDVLRLFYKDEEIVFEEKPPEDFRGIFISSSAYEDFECCIIETSVKKDETQLRIESSSENTKKYIKKEIKRQVYKLLTKLTGKNMPWGVLTGIRPAKIVRDMMDMGLDKEKIMESLKDYYMMSEDKMNIAYEIAEVDKRMLDAVSGDMIGIYVGIPFCPTRCLYCSFTSEPISKYRSIVGEYIRALKDEITAVSEIIKDKGLRIQSIYIGGGTPTSLDANYLSELLLHIEETFDLSYSEEYTLEAGRPDSIDSDKLSVIKQSRVDRISINPQSMNDETLDLIGRRHNAEDVVEAFALAREHGFNNINMDVIAGLPGENLDAFRRTMEAIKILGPESVTVHTMSIKRAARLNAEKDNYSITDESEVMSMIELAQKYAINMGMHPYYIYRQKNTLGNLENVGYCKKGFESIYNVQIMEERQTIIAVGAGASTKVVYPAENRIERAFNVKDIKWYIERLDQMIDRKKQLLDML